ncbi:MarR family winged helix-turn-helix transcriptional regulator [Staphylococcus warneri]|jgi:DNA-binding MarR family transcriptional regulator|uniref:MarR family transcriptional regulator n=1 Tax=Staphylococcus warneri TaxID=1292 RepID=A0A2T4Q187_STAWA|nr:MarR family transcriptional regulator [Staphylococcus warneri]MBY6180400.1 MarR family transcriptional regulator [Staphylococcaceae bacterium DP2N0-1]EEQ79658.1 transcriptional regulator, MarR family [Staphylococcus warneri L37603]MBO0378330.1 MarR family transcriptional regulator [Staphylococcus warneri]MCJ1804682.1 MarR family transcriptional regulator [Staphylococcus warneri]PTI12521.1 MarR family transcriptional regulator [Staphylococcus warneri]
MNDDNNQNDVKHDDMVTSFRDLGRRVVLYQHKIAEQLDVYNHDWTTIDMLSETGPITAGELGRRVGLTTGSVTALVDRLERAGYVKRERHPKDRRSIMIVPQYEDKSEVQHVYETLNQHMTELTNQYTAEQMETIQSFLKATTAILDNEIERKK